MLLFLVLPALFLRYRLLISINLQCQRVESKFLNAKFVKINWISLVSSFICTYYVPYAYAFIRFIHSVCGQKFLPPSQYAGNNFYHLLSHRQKNKMANISLTLYTFEFFGSVLKSPTSMGSLSVNNLVMNISRLGTFKTIFYLTFSMR